MARSALGDVAGRPSILLLWTILTTITPNYAFDLVPRTSDTCPESYKKCENFSDTFCCPTSSTCMSLDDSSSVICCPQGQTCAYIQTITCDVQHQNATLHPKNSVKTTRLDDELPKCGDSCCPFGYECNGQVCGLDNNTSSPSSSSSLSISSTSTTDPSPAPTSTPSSTTSATTSTTNSATSTATDQASSSDALVIVPTTSPQSKTSDSSASHSSSPSAFPGTSSVALAESDNCPSFPTSAILAGFFPGAVFGAVTALLITYCFRRRRQNLPPSAKLAHFTERTSNGTLVGISGPIPSDDTAFRTDFLLCQDKNNTQNRVAEVSRTRSKLHRTGFRVKSFLSNHHLHDNTDGDIPLVPPLPTTPQKTHPPLSKSRQPSTESIRVYTPPNELFSTTGRLKPEPYPTAAPYAVAPRPDTTFTEMIDRVGFRNQKGDPYYPVVNAGINQQK